MSVLLLSWGQFSEILLLLSVSRRRGRAFFLLLFFDFGVL